MGGAQSATVVLQYVGYGASAEDARRSLDLCLRFNCDSTVMYSAVRQCYYAKTPDGVGDVVTEQRKDVFQCTLR